MKLTELFKSGGRGVIATADNGGNVNTAVYALPHIIDENTVAWGMTESRTYRNVLINPLAAYLYMNPGKGYSGVRLSLKLKNIEDSGVLLDAIRERTAEIVSPQAAAAVKHVAYFEVIEIRPLL